MDGLRFGKGVRRGATLRALAAITLVAASVPLVGVAAGAATSGALAIGDATIVEGEAGTINKMAFQVSLAQPQGSPVTVVATVASGTAEVSTAATHDVKPLVRTVSFKAGQTAKSLVVLAYGDANVEGDETYTVTLSSPTGPSTITDGTATGTIVDDDPLVGNALTLGDISVPEGDAVTALSGTVTAKLAVTLAAPAASDVTVYLASYTVTATEGTDYKKVAGYYGAPKKVIIRAGKYQVFLPVRVVVDTSTEGDETFEVSVTSVSGPPLTVSRGTGTVTIADDD